MSKYTKAESTEDVLNVMQTYNNEKDFNFSDPELEYHSENCYLFFESRRWSGVKYWPAVVKRWLLNESKKQRYKKPKSQKGKPTARQRIIDNEF